MININDVLSNYHNFYRNFKKNFYHTLNIYKKYSQDKALKIFDIVVSFYRYTGNIQDKDLYYSCHYTELYEYYNQNNILDSLITKSYNYDYNILTILKKIHQILNIGVDLEDIDNIIHYCMINKNVLTVNEVNEVISQLDNKCFNLSKSNYLSNFDIDIQQQYRKTFYYETLRFFKYNIYIVKIILEMRHQKIISLSEIDNLIH